MSASLAKKLRLKPGTQVLLFKCALGREDRVGRFAIRDDNRHKSGWAIRGGAGFCQKQDRGQGLKASKPEGALWLAYPEKTESSELSCHVTR